MLYKGTISAAKLAVREDEVERLGGVARMNG
jgi:hypothetical protein